MCDDTDPSDSVKDYCDALADEYQRKTESNELGRCSSNQFHRMFCFSLKAFLVITECHSHACLPPLCRCPTTKTQVASLSSVCAMTDNSVKNLWGTSWYMRWLVVACASQTGWPTSFYRALWLHGRRKSSGTLRALASWAQLVYLNYNPKPGMRRDSRIEFSCTQSISF